MQSDVWTRDLPIRTSADLGVFRDVVSLPRRYGRSVTGELIPINRERTLFLWADHASLAVRSVSVDGQSYDGWSWRNDKDPNGLPITVVQTVDQIDDGVRIIATGDGALNATSGALIVNPADMARDLCRIAGLELPSSTSPSIAPNAWRAILRCPARSRAAVCNRQCCGLQNPPTRFHPARSRIPSLAADNRFRCRNNQR